MPQPAHVKTDPEAARMVNRGGRICLAGFPHEMDTGDSANIVRNSERIEDAIKTRGVERFADRGGIEQWKSCKGKTQCFGRADNIWTASAMAARSMSVASGCAM